MQPSPRTRNGLGYEDEGIDRLGCLPPDAAGGCTALAEAASMAWTGIAQNSGRGRQFAKLCIDYLRQMGCAGRGVEKAGEGEV